MNVWLVGGLISPPPCRVAVAADMSPTGDLLATFTFIWVGILSSLLRDLHVQHNAGGRTLFGITILPTTPRMVLPLPHSAYTLQRHFIGVLDFLAEAAYVGYLKHDYVQQKNVPSSLRSSIAATSGALN